MSKMEDRGQGAFEYILLLAGILLIVILVIVILKSVILSPANANIQSSNDILTQVSAIPEIPGAWVKYSCSNPVIPTSLDPVSFIDVVLAGGVYYGFYTNNSGGPTNYGNIGLLNSTDGVNWELVNNSIINPTPYAWDGVSVGLPYVMYNNGEFQMWYIGSNDTEVASWTSDFNQSVGYASSSDGIHWNVNSAPVFTTNSTSTWDNYSIAPGVVVLKDGDTYKMWYGAINYSGDVHSSIGYATSTDGVTWQRWNSTGGPVIANAIPGAILKSGIYYLSLGILTSTFVTAESTSTDGITWSQPSVTMNNSPSCFDSQQAIIVSIILSNDQYLAWYYSNNGAPAGVGYATAPVQILTS